MREIDSDALRLVAQSLGIGNPVTAVDQVTFDDAVLQQVLDVGPLVRRGGTLRGTSGLYAADFDQVHAIAGSITTTVDPYAPSSPGGGYPSPVPQGLDVWLLTAQLAAAVGDHHATQASRCTILIPGVQRAFGDAAPTNYSNEYAAFLGEQPITGGAVAYITIVGSGLINARRAVRIPRGGTIAMNSVSAAAGTITWQFMIGLFPAALGQDAFGAS